MQLVDSMTEARLLGRRATEKLLADLADRGGVSGPDRDTWGLQPHQVAATARAMRVVPEA